MEPLFERLLKRTFPDSVTAIEYCRNLCAEFGFTVKQEASANRVKRNSVVTLEMLNFLNTFSSFHRIFMFTAPEKVFLTRSETQNPRLKESDLPNAATVAGVSSCPRTNTNNGSFASP